MRQCYLLADPCIVLLHSMYIGEVRVLGGMGGDSPLPVPTGWFSSIDPSLPLRGPCWLYPHSGPVPLAGYPWDRLSHALVTAIVRETDWQTGFFKPLVGMVRHCSEPVSGSKALCALACKPGLAG